MIVGMAIVCQVAVWIGGSWMWSAWRLVVARRILLRWAEASYLAALVAADILRMAAASLSDGLVAAANIA